MYDLFLYFSVGFILVLELVIRGSILGVIGGYVHLRFLKSYVDFRLVYLGLMAFSFFFSEKTLLFSVVFELLPGVSTEVKLFSMVFMFAVSVLSFNLASGKGFVET